MNEILAEWVQEDVERRERKKKKKKMHRGRVARDWVGDVLPAGRQLERRLDVGNHSRVRFVRAVRKVEANNVDAGVAKSSDHFRRLGLGTDGGHNRRLADQLVVLVQAHVGQMLDVCQPNTNQSVFAKS